jgi:general secretion pathway protein J
MKQRQGFTLIELLIAITILASIAVLGWRGLDALVRARVALTSDLEKTRGLQLAFAQMQSDCAHIAGPAMLVNRTALVVTQDSLVLVRTVNQEDQPTGLQIVAYRLNGGVLSRRESVATRDLGMLDQDWLAATGATDANRDIALQSGVQSMRVRTWINDGAGWRRPGIDAAPGGVAGAAAAGPSGLEVSLVLQGETPNMMTKIFLLGPA